MIQTKVTILAEEQLRLQQLLPLHWQKVKLDETC